MMFKAAISFISVTLLGLSTSIAFADTPSVSGNPTEEAQIQMLIQQNQELKKEMAELKQEVQAKPKTVKKQQKKASPIQLAPIPTTTSNNNATSNDDNNTSDDQDAYDTNTNSKDTAKTTNDINTPIKPPVHHLFLLSDTPTYLAGIPVILSPYLGVPPAYDASDLLVSFPGINSDLILLQERQNINSLFADNNLPEPDHFVSLSGLVIGQASVARPYTGPRESDLDLNTARLAMIAAVNSWITGYLSFSYDSTAPFELNPPQLGPRIANSRIYLDSGFFTVGNLDKADFYGSFGQFSVPFGQYNTYMLTNPLTADLGQTNARALLLGYNHTYDAYNTAVQVFTFKGDSTDNASQNIINQWGGNVDFTVTKDDWNANIGGGYIANIADSSTMQLNGNPILSTQFTGASTGVFGGFAENPPTSQTLAFRIPAIDLHGDISVGPFTLLAEHVAAIHAFAPGDLSYNNSGARPSANDLEASYRFNVWDKPSSISVGYGNSSQALALMLPQFTYGITLSTSLLKDTVESLGFNRELNYPANVIASGDGFPTSLNSPDPDQGQYSNSIIAQMSVFF